MHYIDTTPSSSLPLLSPTQIQANLDATVSLQFGFAGQGAYTRLGGVVAENGWIQAYCLECGVEKIYFSAPIPPFELHSIRSLEETIAPASKGAEVSPRRAVCAKCVRDSLSAHARGCILHAHGPRIGVSPHSLGVGEEGAGAICTDMLPTWAATGRPAMPMTTTGTRDVASRCTGGPLILAIVTLDRPSRNVAIFSDNDFPMSENQFASVIGSPLSENHSRP